MLILRKNCAYENQININPIESVEYDFGDNDLKIIPTKTICSYFALGI